MQSNQMVDSVVHDKFLKLISSHLSLDQKEKIYFSDWLSDEVKRELETDLSKAGRLKGHLFFRKMANWINAKSDKDRKSARPWRKIWGGSIVVLILIRIAMKSLYLGLFIAAAAIVGVLYARHQKMNEVVEDSSKFPEPPKQHEIKELSTKVGKNGYNQVMFAVQSWNLAELRTAVSTTLGGVSQPDAKGYTALIYALNSNYTDGIKFLLEKGAAFDFDEPTDKKDIMKFIKSEGALWLLLNVFDARKKGEQTYAASE